jgi:hypothetical protein
MVSTDLDLWMSRLIDSELWFYMNIWTLVFFWILDYTGWMAGLVFLDLVGFSLDRWIRFFFRTLVFLYRSI